jgi:hypothetical protein
MLKKTIVPSAQSRHNTAMTIPLARMITRIIANVVGALRAMIAMNMSPKMRT